MQRLPQRLQVASVPAAAILFLTWKNRRRREQNTCTFISSSSGRTTFGASVASASSWRSLAATLCAPSVTQCEEERHHSPLNNANRVVSTPSLFRKTLAALHIRALPIPRRLVPGDPLFSDARLQKGLRQRRLDEIRLRSLQERIVKAVRETRDTEAIRALHQEVCEIAYGKGVTPQMREDFVMRYGCTGWTDAVLHSLIDLADARGFVEIGAGNGQWARALTDRFNRLQPPTDSTTQVFEFVLAFDDMSELPLSPDIYHAQTQPAHDYFYRRVQKCDDVQTVLRQWSCRGRVLLLVYPPSGSMAVETVKAYVQLGPENDTVVYVGEGRGGANANEDLFDYFESGDWAILQVHAVEPQPGGKGYEKCYVLQRIKNTQSDEGSGSEHL